MYLYRILGIVVHHHSTLAYIADFHRLRKTQVVTAYCSHAHKTLPAPSQTAPTSKHSPATVPSGSIAEEALDDF